jgi:hypothetical protein
LFQSFELGLPVLSKQLKFSPSKNAWKRGYHERICSSKGHNDVDEGNAPLQTRPLPPHVPSTSSDDLVTPDGADVALVGEDAAAFDVTSQSTSSWILGVVLAILYVVWIDPETGYGSAYIDAISSLSSSHEVRLEVVFFIS